MGIDNSVLVIFLFLGLITKDLAAPIDVSTTEGQKDWLKQHKYLEEQPATTRVPGVADIIGNDRFTNAVRRFQRFLGLPETGIVDDQTKEYMTRKRCGMGDNANTGDKRNYVLQGFQYSPGTTVTYRINVYSEKLSKQHQDQIFKDAFDHWARIANIKFQEVRNTRYAVDIEIIFARGSHGDDQPFDGPNNTLAHAYFPNYGGDQHYDEDENWTDKEYNGTNLLQTVTHEMGHSLGLDHSMDRNSVMYPYIKRYDPNFSLEYDDILGVFKLYGPADLDSTSSTESTTLSTTPISQSSTPTSTTITATTTSQVSPKIPFDQVDICYNGSIDAVTLTKDNSTYIFRGNNVYKINDLFVEPGYPVRIEDKNLGFSPVIGRIDAALFWPTIGHTYLFQGDFVAIFEDRTFIGNYSADEVLKLPNAAKPADAVFYWPGSGKTFVTKGNRYWRFDTGTGQLNDGYPQPMSVWGLPAGADAAFQYSNGRTYFFKGSQYYRFDDVNIQMVPGYPRPVAYWWFGCRSAQ